MAEIVKYKLREMMKKTGVMVSVGLNKDSSYHTHDCIQICYVKDGHARQTLGDKTVKLSKGDFYIVDIGQGHDYFDTNDSFPQFCVRFLPSMLWPGFSDDFGADELVRALCSDDEERSALSSVVGRVFHDKNGIIQRRVRNIKREWEKRPPGWLRIVGGELAAILLTMARTAETFPVHTSNTTFVSDIKDYIEDHYAEPIQLEQLCRMCSYTMSYVSRVFRESTGQSFSEYLLAVRVRKACTLLEETRMTVSKIGKAVGYSNTSFFYRVFKSITGMTPREWRQQTTEKPEEEKES